VSTSSDLLTNLHADFMEGRPNNKDVLINTGTEIDELFSDCGDSSDESNEFGMYDNEVDSLHTCESLVDEIAQWRAKHSITVDVLVRSTCHFEAPSSQSAQRPTHIDEKC